MATMLILLAKLRIKSNCGPRGFHQQHAQHAIALLRDRTQVLPSARRMLARNQTQITRHLLAAREASYIAHGQHVSQRRDRTDSWLGLKEKRHFVSLRFCLHRLVEWFDLPVEHRHQPEQVVPSTSCPWPQRQLAQHLDRKSVV